MALTHRWSGRSEAELIGRVRMQCYAASPAELPRFVASVSVDDRCRDGEFLLVERDGVAVGTATSAHLRMFIRGAGIACHGVAFVGAVRTERRKAASSVAVPASTEPGVATRVMHETIRRGRDRGDVVSALMPFRSSFYEHFGYGIVERRATWTLPMTVLPSGSGGAVTDAPFFHYEPSLLPGLVSLRQAIVEAGNCDIERSEGEWRDFTETADDGFIYVCPGSAWVRMKVEFETGVGVLRINDWGARDTAGLVRILRFLGSQRDQYARAYLTTQADVPLNWLLKESQVPHRPVAHATPEVRCYTRMQLRVLDHVRLLEAMQWPVTAHGQVVAEVHETEGHRSRLHINVDGGRASVRPTDHTPTFTTTDRAWAALVTGDQPADALLRFGLATGDAGPLASLATGPKPFTFEYF